MENSAVDLTRAIIRLEGLSLYGVVAVLLLNFSFNMISSTPTSLDEGERSENMVKIAFLLCSGFTILLGTHTAIVFMLLEVYTKTALGMAKDIQFLAYMDATSEIRKSGFYALLLSMMSFIVSYLLSMYLSMDKRLRWWFTMLATIVLAVSVQQVIQIIMLSTEILFA